MNGLVSGLQNQPRRFDSATHLQAKAVEILQLLFLFYSNLHSIRNYSALVPQDYTNWN